MATSALLKLEGQTQGWIKGGVTQKGREGLIEVTSWSWGAERNFQGQLPSGSATASEFHITKQRDRGTPLLLNAFANNERFDEWRFDLWDPIDSGAGAEHDADRAGERLSRLRPVRRRRPGRRIPPDHEELTFVFEKITVTWLDGNLTGILDLGKSVTQPPAPPAVARPAAQALRDVFVSADYRGDDARVVLGVESGLLLDEARCRSPAGASPPTTHRSQRSSRSSCSATRSRSRSAASAPERSCSSPPGWPARMRERFAAR